MIDVAIVGAGPAGSSAAAELAAGGFSVAVFEREAFPRRKVCGEFLSAEGRRQLDRWGLGREIEAAGAEKITEGGFYLADGRSASFVLPEAGTGISRWRLDEMLAANAARRGADVRFSREVVGLEGSLALGFEVLARGPEGESRVRARAAVSAWGRWSPLDLAFGREFASRNAGRFFGWSRALDGDSSRLAGRVHLYFFPGGYCGLSRVENGAVNFAGVVSEDRLREAGGGWEGFTARLRETHAPLAEHLAPLRPRGEILGTPTVLFEKHSATFRDILAAGDASGVRDPFTGDGQASAIAGGILVARLLSEFLRGEIGAAELARRYRTEWSRRFGPRFGWDALFRRLVLSPRLQRAALPFAGPLVSLGFRATRSS